MKKLLFFTYADKNYEIFAIPYIWFALNNNPDAFVEITLEDLNGFLIKYCDALKILDSVYKGQYKLSQSEYSLKNVVPNTIRFLDSPSVVCEYIYIGDIDLLVFDNVYEVHSGFIKKYDLQYSNVVRDKDADKPRLTGLHFCKYDKFYPAPDLSDIDLSKENDEHILYLYMLRKGFVINYHFRERPECGIHLSLNRDPLGRYSGQNSGVFKIGENLAWAGSGYYKKLLEQISTTEYSQLERHLDFKYRSILFTLEAIARDLSDQLHWIAIGSFIDKRLLSVHTEYDIYSFNRERDFLLKNKKFIEAEELSKYAAMLWPNNLDVLRKLVWILFCNKKIEEALVVLKRMMKLPDGVAVIVKFEILQKNMALLKDLGKAGEDFLSDFHKIVSSNNG